MEDYLKAFDPEATIEKYAYQLGADVNPPIAGSKSKPVPGYVYAKSSRTGLPIGLQIVTRPWEDYKLVGFAHDFEQATKIRKPPKL